MFLVTLPGSYKLRNRGSRHGGDVRIASDDVTTDIQCGRACASSNVMCVGWNGKVTGGAGASSGGSGTGGGAGGGAMYVCEMFTTYDDATVVEDSTWNVFTLVGI